MIERKISTSGFNNTLLGARHGPKSVWFCSVPYGTNCSFISHLPPDFSEDSECFDVTRGKIRSSTVNFPAAEPTGGVFHYTLQFNFGLNYIESPHLGCFYLALVESLSAHI